MNKLIYNIQDKVVDLLSQGDNDFKEASIDNCSEVVRLVANWFFDENLKFEIKVLKGDNVLNTNKSHDILLIIYNNDFYIIDPTIWQFFPATDKILISIEHDEESCLSKLKYKYGGIWNISEILTPHSYNEKELLTIIYDNLSFK